MNDHTGPYKGGPMDGRTVSGGDVMHYAFAETKAVHRYQWDRDRYRHQGRRNILKNGLDDSPTVRVCNECHIVREDYISPQCSECGSRHYRRF